MSLINIILNFSRWSITQWVKLPTRPKNQTCRHTLQYQLTKIMKGMCWQTLRGLQNAGFLYYSLKRSLPPIFDIYLQFLPTHSIHNLRQTLLFKYSDFWWFYGQLKLWANKTMVQCIPTEKFISGSDLGHKIYALWRYCHSTLRIVCLFYL